MYIKPVMALMFKIINFLLHYRSKWFSLFIYLICINIKRALDLLEKLFYLNKNDTLFVDLLKLCYQSSGGQQQFTIQSETGEVMTVNPETIIVQEGDEQVLVTDGNQPEGGHQQYVIQYVNQEQMENSMVEIQTIQDVQHFQTIEQEIIQSMDTHSLGDNVVEQQIVQSWWFNILDTCTPLEKTVENSFEKKSKFYILLVVYIHICKFTFWLID